MKCPESGCDNGIKTEWYQKRGVWQKEETACDCCGGTGEVFQEPPRVLPDRPRILKRSKKKKK